MAIAWLPLYSAFSASFCPYACLHSYYEVCSKEHLSSSSFCPYACLHSYYEVCSKEHLSSSSEDPSAIRCGRCALVTLWSAVEAQKSLCSAVVSYDSLVTYLDSPLANVCQLSWLWSFKSEPRLSPQNLWCNAFLLLVNSKGVIAFRVWVKLINWHEDNKIYWSCSSCALFEEKCNQINQNTCIYLLVFTPFEFVPLHQLASIEFNNFHKVMFYFFIFLGKIILFPCHWQKDFHRGIYFEFIIVALLCLYDSCRRDNALSR